MSNGTPLRTCGGCSRFFATWSANQPGTTMFLCDDCKSKMPVWDPQPYEPPQIGKAIVQHDCSLLTDKRAHRVVAREGDRLTVRRYTYPGLGDPITVQVSDTRPFTGF